MGSFSIWHWIIVILYVTLTITFFKSLVRLLNRLGFSGWWSVFSLIPIINIIALRALSKAKWRQDDGEIKRVFN